MPDIIAPQGGPPGISQAETPIEDGQTNNSGGTIRLRIPSPKTPHAIDGSEMGRGAITSTVDNVIGAVAVTVTGCKVAGSGGGGSTILSSLSLSIEKRPFGSVNR